jgi:hypothetical protein
LAAVHLVKYVVLTDGTIEVENICIPPVLDVHQPVNVYPALAAGVGNVPNCVPGVKLDVVSDPLLFHVIVTLAAVHLAKYVVLTDGTTEVENSCVPPVLVETVHQPENV